MGGFHSERHLHQQRRCGIETVKELLSFQDLCQIAIESLHCGQSPEESCKFKDWPKWSPRPPFSQVRIISDEKYLKTKFDFLFSLELVFEVQKGPPFPFGNSQLLNGKSQEMQLHKKAGECFLKMVFPVWSDLGRPNSSRCGVI